MVGLKQESAALRVFMVSYTSNKSQHSLQILNKKTVNFNIFKTLTGG
jgi:hypothetical protein